MTLIAKILRKVNRRFKEIIKGSEYIALTLNPQEARSQGVTIGERCRLFSMDFGSEPFLVSLGDHVTVTANVSFVTHDGGVWVFRDQNPQIELFAPIRIGNNVFIGVRTVILPGSVVGNDSIVAAGSIVRGTFPDRSIIAGVPARVISTIDEYFSKNEHRFSYFRNLPPDEKRRAILEQFPDFQQSVNR